MSRIGRPPKPKAEKFVRVTLTMRPDDFSFLAKYAYREFLKIAQNDALWILHQGERPGASMAIRLLIDAERKRRAK